MTVYTVASGQTSSGLMLGSADTIFVQSGGRLVSSILLDATGNVAPGAIAIDTVVQGSNAVFKVEGSATSGIVQAGGQEVILQGGSAMHDVIGSGGIALVLTGGADRGVTVKSGGVLVQLPGSTVNVHVRPGGTVMTAGNVVIDGATGGGVILPLHASGAVPINAVEYVFGAGAIAQGMVLNGTEQIVLSGGLAKASRLEFGGHQIVSSGGIATGTRADEARVEVSSGGTTSGARLGTESDLTVYAGGNANSTHVAKSAVIELLSGSSLQTDLAGGKEDVYAGVAINTQVGAGSFQILEPSGSGIASATVIASGGQQIVQAGITSGDTILRGGLELVSGGGRAHNATVSAGGTLVLLPGALDDGTVALGGTVVHAGQVILSGAAAKFAGAGMVSGGIVSGPDEQGLVYGSGGAAVSGAVVFYASQYVLSGASTSAYRVSSGGFIQVDTGATAAAMIVGNQGSLAIDGMLSGAQVRSGGDLQVFGVAADVTVLSGGKFLLYGSATNALVIGGEEVLSINSHDTGANIRNGGVQSLFVATASGAIIGAGGAQIVGANGTATGSIVGSGGYQQVSSGGDAFGSIVDSSGRLILDRGGYVNGAVISVGGILELADMAFVSGGSAHLDPGTDVLTVTAGGVTSQVSLGGSYFATSFALAAGPANDVLVTAVSTGHIPTLYMPTRIEIADLPHDPAHVPLLVLLR